jgi:uncharacterized protein (TIRG00374 family)
MDEEVIPAPAPATGATAPARSLKLRNFAFRFIGVAGLALFVYLISKTGPARIWEAIRKLSLPEMLALLGLRVVYWGVRTLNWRALLRSAGEHVPFLALFGARIAGSAVGFLTPAGNIGAETMRVFMLDRIDRKKVVASVIVDKTIEFLAGIFTISLSVAFLISTFTMSRGHKVMIVALTVGFFGLLVFLMALQKRGLFIWILDGLAKIRLPIRALEKRRDKIREMDARISEFYTRRRGLFFLLFGSYFMQSWIWALEIFATFAFIGGSSATLLKCFLMVTLGSFFTFIPVPGALGVYELTYVSLFALLGIEMSVGMAVILARRILSLVWSGIGLIPILRKRSTQGRSAA